MKFLNRESFAALGALLVLAVLAVISARDVGTPPDSFASTDYATGGYRAWATLLAREGVNTGRFVQRPIELDAGTDTLISAQPLPFSPDAAARTARDMTALVAWVRRGGRLVYIGRNRGLTSGERTQLSLPFRLPAVGKRGPLTGPLAPPVGTLAGLGPDRMLFVERAGRSELADGNGDIVVRYPLGRGDVIAVVDAEPFTNAHLAQAGNARLAYAIGLPRHRGGRVAFDDGVHGALIERPWYRALPMPVRVGLGIAGFAIALALAGGALRSGPAVRLEPKREPTSAEFVDALAALYERTQARTDARAILADEALHVAARSVGAHDRLTPDDVAARTATLPGGDAVRALAADLHASVTTDGELLASARLAHTVRKEFTHDGNGDGRRAAFAGRSRTRRRR